MGRVFCNLAELCINRLHLVTLLFLNYTSSVVKINDALLRKIEIQFFFIFFALEI